MADPLTCPAQTDTAPLLSEFADDPDMGELVELFLAELPDRVAALERAMRARDAEMISHLAHQLKGAGGGYGYPAITDNALLLERAAREGKDVDHLVKPFQALAHTCHRATLAHG